MYCKKTFFQRVGRTPIIPISFKIIGVFTCLLLLSNFATNFISIQLSQSEVFKLTNDIMVSQLKDIYNAASNQYEIYLFSHDKQAATQVINQISKKGFSQKNSLALSTTPEGNISFFSSASNVVMDVFPDEQTLENLNTGEASK